jgi:hypothetical protein
MKIQLKHILTMLALTGLAAATLQADQLAFPGAQGFGAYATGGRTGSVYHVTTLADGTGAGTFRTAVGTANRIVVFDVGGYISLTNAVSVKGNITIAGQSAPGGGIGFKGGEISFANRSNIICRCIRIRPGDDTASTDDDALSFYEARNIICDHVSLEFAPYNNIDGVGSTSYPVSEITVQNSIIADPTGQQFGAHTECVGGTWAWYNNLFANSHNRNPLAKENTVFINNVLYNCSAGYTTHTSTEFEHDIVNNYFIAGPAYSSSSDFPWYQMDTNQDIYYSGNLKDLDKDGALDGTTTTPYFYQGGSATILSSPWSSWTTGVTIVSPASAFGRVVSFSGAFPRDQIDALVISQVKTLGSGTTGLTNGTVGPDSSLYTSQTETGLTNNGYGGITSGAASLDTDADGIPDYWERAMGLSTNSADSMTISTNGYTYLENYLNWLADPHVAGYANSNIDLDLSQYAAGFSSASYSVSFATNGTVVLTNSTTARFTPTAGFYGLGSYKFTVTGSTGGSMTLTVGVLVQPAAASAPSAPTGLSAVAGNAQVILTWVQSTSASITQNKIYCSTNGSSGTYNLIATLSATTSYTNAGLVNGNTYYYSVTAVNANGESALSAYIGAIPQVPAPSAPTGLTAAAGNAQVALSWTASSSATSYRIKQSTASGGSYVNIATNTATTYTNTGLVNGTTYYYVVSAVNAGGESTNSSQVSAMPQASSVTTNVFKDAFSSSTLNSKSPAAPTGTNTSYELISSKSWSPTPTSASGHLKFGIAATSSGSIEVQALFAKSPVALTNVGDSLSLIVTFTNTSGLLTQSGALGFGLYNGGTNYPVAGGLNGVATTSYTTNATGGAQNWVGYVGQLAFTNASSLILTRPAQTTGSLANNDQDLVTSGSGSSSYTNNPPVTVGTASTTASLVAAAGSPCTEFLTVTVSATNTLAITNRFYSGMSTNGTLLSQFGGVASGSTYLTNSFNALAVGWRATASTSATTMDINQITVNTTRK